MASRAPLDVRACGRRSPPDRAQSERGNEAHGLRLLGEIASRENDVDAAEASYAEAMALAREHGMRPLVARGRLGLGLLWQRRGEFAQARSDLGESVRLLREMAMTGWLEKAELALGSLP